MNIGLPTDYLKQLLLRCTLNVQFRFNDVIYNQRDGVAMGSPLGPLLADVFMASLENGPLKETIDSLFMYKRYVDDTFIVCDENTSTAELLRIFNGSHPCLLFTIEEESDSSFHFLDVKLDRRENGTLLRSIYRKPTFTGQYTNFNSWVPLGRKRNLIHSLCSRIRKICSPETIDRELDNLRSNLLNNGYPKRFIERNIKKESTPRQVTVPKKKLFISLAFKGDTISELIKNRLSKCIKRTFPAADLHLVFTSRNMIRQCVKDRLPLLSTSMCIYSFTCSCGAVYIGRCKRNL
uniref:Reverse transcriptase domain-containing protein n=1 Tax=Trichobilharzia regenti TaxID=157069 RepID=A0AA85IUX5_TRIRE|nr:unnamed protein product [Trichobilharzia regenti]